MNQKQKIFNLLAKTGKTQISKSRKVNFALTDDLNEASRTAEEIFADITKSVTAAYDTVGDAIAKIPAPDSFYQDLDFAAMQLGPAINETRSAADQLGISPKDIPGFIEAETAMSFLEQAREIVGRYEDEIGPILRLGGF